MKSAGPIWERKSRADKDEYKISQKHPLLRFCFQLNRKTRRTSNNNRINRKVFASARYSFALSEDGRKEIFQGYVALPSELIEWLKIQAMSI